MRPAPAVTIPPVGNVVGAKNVVGVTIAGNDVAGNNGAGNDGDAVSADGNNAAGDPAVRNTAIRDSVRGGTGGAANAEAPSAALNRNAGHARFTLLALRRECGVCRSRGSFNTSNPV
jgi:hypothetical protein